MKTVKEAREKVVRKYWEKYEGKLVYCPECGRSNTFALYKDYEGNLTYSCIKCNRSHHTDIKQGEVTRLKKESKKLKKIKEIFEE